MAIRINHHGSAAGEVIELHGWLTAEVVGEFDHLRESIEGPVVLDLRGLAGADEAGVRSLQAQVGAGTRLEGASPYIQLLLRPRP